MLDPSSSPCCASDRLKCHQVTSMVSAFVSSFGKEWGGEGMLGQLALDRHLKDMKHMDSCPLSALLELSFPAPRSYPAMPGCSHAAGGDLLTHS